MLVKFFIIFTLLTILSFLASGLYHLLTDKGEGDKTVKALTWRMGLSITLFVLLFVGFALGIIKPHPGPEAMTTIQQPAKN